MHRPLLATSAPLAFLPEVVALLLSCVVILYVCQRLRLVPIVAFLLTGVLIGPNAVGLVRDVGQVEVLAEIGAMLLLFTIGMEFSLDDLMRQMRVILVAGGLQVGLTVVLATIVLAVFNVSWEAGVFTGCLLALSSDALAMKLLVDRGETATRTGQATVGILVFQDLAAVAMILFVPVLGGQGGGILDVAWALFKATGTIAAVLIVARKVLPPLLEFVAKTCLPELFLLTVTAICFGTAWLTSLAGVNLALGAFLAGLVISGSRFKDLAFGEILPMRTLFSAAFFVSLGMLLDPQFVVAHPALVLGAVGVVLVLRLVTTAVGLAVLRTPPRIIFVSGLLMAQVGEFSFVLQRAGLEAGLSPFGLGADGAQAFIAASVLMMALTPLFAEGAWRIDAWLGRRAETSGVAAVGGHNVALEGHLVIAGYGAGARPLARMLHAAGVPFGIVTLNPDGAAEAQREGFTVRLGDSGRAHGLQLMAVEKAKMLVCADDDPATARRVAAVARTLNPTLAIVVRTARLSAVDPLLAAGADQVIAEEMEGIVQLFVRVLDGYLVPREEVARHVETLRSAGYAAIRPGAATALALPCSGLDGDCLDTRSELSGTVEPPEGRCAHSDQTHAVEPRTKGCEECLARGLRWVHLRVCMTCGHVGCCDSSIGKHATAHHKSTGHPIVRSLEPGETWGWCYIDEQTL